MAGRAVGSTYKDRFTVESEVILLENSFDGLTLASTISLADLQTALGDPGLVDNSTMRGRIAVTDQTDYGRCLSITLPASTQGVVFQAALSSSFDEGYIEYDFRFRSGFPWGGVLYQGGKMPGLAGKDDQVANPPSGSAPTPHGWGGRSMWLGDAAGGTPNGSGTIEWIGYRYAPNQAAGTFGTNMHTNISIGTEYGTSDGTWHHVKKYYVMNTCGGHATTTDPATLVQGTDYQADGRWDEILDGATTTFSNQVLRMYEPAKCTHMQFSLFYGGDSSWAGAGGTIDFANLRIVQVNA